MQIKNLPIVEKFFHLRWTTLFLLLALGLIVSGCGGQQGGGSEEGEIKVVASTSVIADMVEEVGGERVEVQTLVEPGAEVHTFQPSPSDVQKVAESEVVFENGLGLENWLEDLVENAGGQASVVELSEGLEVIDADHEEEGGHEGDHGHEHAEGNPHLWLDVENAERYVERIRDELIEVDPSGRERYEENARDYLAQLRELDLYIQDSVARIPEENRKLVTFHDAFVYFAHAYGLEEVGVIIRNPEDEPSSREVSELVREIKGQGVPAIFTEPQFRGGLADTVAQEAGVEVYELYSDTLTEGGEADTYVQMMRTNADRVAEGLGG